MDVQGRFNRGSGIANSAKLAHWFVTSSAGAAFIDGAEYRGLK
jgi:hypothetical protein